MMNKQFKYFSQHGEDYLLWEFFGRKQYGFFVDVGAFDGVHLSNSYSFELGSWNGICVEAHPDYFSLCLNARQKSLCIRAACVGDEKIETVEFLTEELGLHSEVNVGHADVANRYRSRGIPFPGFKRVTVQAVTLNLVLDKHLPENTEIDFISIDVEGTEIDVLKGLDLGKFRPRILVIEANSEEMKKKLDDYLARKDYVFSRCVNVNAFYTREQADADRLREIDIQCFIEPQKHPWGDSYTLQGYAQGKVIDIRAHPQRAGSPANKEVSLAHIINPVIVGQDSDLYVAQPVTFESMRIAKSMAGNRVSVDLYSAQYAEDQSIVPAHLEKTPALTRSIDDMGNFKGSRRLPLIADILDRLYEASDASYLIYTNVDIALMPQFYLCVLSIIRAGYDAFTINRRTIPGNFKTTEELPQMYSMLGEPHIGHDCFVFKRELLENFELTKVCIGIDWVGAVLLANLTVHANKFAMIRDVHLTFHIGDNRTWLSNSNQEYRDFNKRQAREVLHLLEKKCGRLDRERYPALKKLDDA